MDNHLGSIVANLARQSAGWDSIRMVVEVERTDYTGNGHSGHIRHEYIETSSNNRLYKLIEVKNNEHVVLEIGYSDGNTFAYETPKTNRTPKRLIYSNVFMHEGQRNVVDRPPPLRYLYTGRKPLFEAIANAEPLPPGVALGRECDVFLLRGARMENEHDYVYYIDKLLYCLVKIDAYSNFGSKHGEHPVWSWSALQFEESSGYQVAVASRLDTYSSQGDGRLRATSEITVSDLSFDEAYPHRTFVPTLRDGVEVFDAVKNEHYVIGTLDPPNLGRPNRLVPSITADPVRHWTLDLAAGLSVGGLILIVSAVLLWWRRRS